MRRTCEELAMWVGFLVGVPIALGAVEIHPHWIRSDIIALSALAGFGLVLRLASKDFID